MYLSKQESTFADPALQAALIRRFIPQHFALDGPLEDSTSSQGANHQSNSMKSTTKSFRLGRRLWVCRSDQPLDAFHLAKPNEVDNVIGISKNNGQDLLITSEPQPIQNPPEEFSELHGRQIHLALYRPRNATSTSYFYHLIPNN